ncbi:MAG: hypothetical protein IJU81_01590 [Bacteroidales bacterium]|nr:hypothetical protein [Bacteroidales bacterium]
MPRRENEGCEETNVFDKQEQWKLAYTAAARKRLMKWNVFDKQEQWKLAYTAAARKRLMK